MPPLQLSQMTGRGEGEDPNNTKRKNQGLSLYQFKSYFLRHNLKKNNTKEMLLQYVGTGSTYLFG
jgi:hypothetical protein